MAIEYLRSLRKEPLHYMGHNPAGSYAIYGILFFGLATGLTGYLTLNEIGGESLEEVHEVCANIWLGLVIVHIAGVFVGSWIHRENLLRSMVTGYKQRVQRQSVRADSGVPAARGLGIMIAAAVGAFWIWTYLTGSVPGASERSVREEASERGQTPEQIQQGREPGRDRLAAGRANPDND
jgi:hypothetical protein